MIELVRTIVGRHARLPDPGQPLAIESVVLVAIVEDLETELDIRVRPGEVSPENFGTVESIAAFVGGKVG